MSSTVQRKLTTILCADVTGYSRLMEHNEEGTLAALKLARELFATELEEYSGRLINMTGDAIIADFTSVVQAVQCAVSIQDKLADLWTQNRDTVPLYFRMGLNLGDVIIDGDDIFGDGVNIAARLEGLAPSGGICISGTVYDHVKGKFPARFTYLGEKQVKNIEDAISVYSLQLGTDTENASEATAPTPPTNRKSQSAADVEADDAALQKQVKQQAVFYRRCLIMGSITLFLFIINIVTSPGYLWFIWATLPMALSLVFNAVHVFGRKHADDWEARKLAQLRKK